MTSKLAKNDGTYFIPYPLHETDQEYEKDTEYEKIVLAEAEQDPKFKDAVHKPFIDWYKPVGRKPYRALIVPATKEEYDVFKRQEDREKKHEEYWSRCEISDGKGGVKQCPVRIPNPDYGKVPGATKTIKNSCELCPKFREGWTKPKNTSLEAMAYNDEGEEIDRPEFGREMLSRSDNYDRVRDIVLDVVMEKNSKYYDTVKTQLDNNLSISGAAKITGVNNSGFDKALKNSLGKEIIEALGNDPFVDIAKLLH